jgi:hypothetical protein
MLRPRMIDDEAIAEALADVDAAVKAFVAACAPYDITAKHIESDLIEFVEKSVQVYLERAREK